MADPTRYDPDYSYTGFQASSPTTPLPADQVDNDLAKIEITTNEIIDALGQVRRSDGRLKNLVVTYDSLSGDMKARLSAIGFDTTEEQVDAIVDAVVDIFVDYGYSTDEENVLLYGGMWSDVDDGEPKVHRFRDRIFIGAAADIVDTRTNPGSWLPDNESGPGFIPRDSNLTVMADLGNIALSGLSRKSDGEDVPVAAPATIGVAGAAINNGNQTVSGRYPTAWAFYGDIQHEPVDNQGSSYGMELAVKNSSVSRTSRPYSVDSTGGAFGVWLAGGGDNRYGPDAANPPNAAIMINKHSESGLTSGWNVGINFQSTAITGSTGAAGETSSAPAIQMARAQEIQWFAPTNPTVKAAFIRSQIDDSNNSMGLVFSNNSLAIQDRAGVVTAKFGDVTSAVNYLQFYNAATGGLPQIQAAGETNVGMEIRLKGTGQGYLSSAGAGNKIRWNSTGLAFFDTAPIAKPTVSGIRASNTALASLCTALANLGLITDTTTAT